MLTVDDLDAELRAQVVVERWIVRVVVVVLFIRLLVARDRDAAPVQVAVGAKPPRKARARGGERLRLAALLLGRQRRQLDQLERLHLLLLERRRQRDAVLGQRQDRLDPRRTPVSLLGAPRPGV